LKTFKTVLLAAGMAGLMLVTNCALADYSASSKNGTIGFSGQHAGMNFSGTFESWTADLYLPVAGSEANKAYINATFDLQTATTGDSIYDETLPEGDWFDVDNHPRGSFSSTNVEPVANGFDVSGELTLRGKTLPVSFKLLKKGRRLTANFPINRLDYGIGVDSDPEAEWVSKNIYLTLDIPSS
jgi:polyisoprenoid-binding protein YceI